MKGYSHLTRHDRLKIESLLRQGHNQAQIARKVRVSPSTISRELKRGQYEHLNSDYTTEIRYSPDIAQERYEANKTAKGLPLKIGSDFELASYIENKIADDKYSPAAVLAEIKNNDTLNFSVSLSVRTVYKYISIGLFLRITNKDLPFRGKRRTEKPRKVKAVRASKGDSIEKRPVHINDRTEFGHWEMDTVHSSQSCRSGLLVLTERMTRQEIIKRIHDRTAATVVRAIDNLEVKFGSLFTEIFKSITMDNGSEFADCSGIECSAIIGQRTKCYYCHPYSAYERGSNEKQNQMIRRHFPKGTNFDSVPDSEVDRVNDWLNNYPRKILDWATSQQVFNKHVEMLNC